MLLRRHAELGRFVSVISVRPEPRTYAIQLVVGGLLVVTAAIAAVTGSSPSWVVPTGLVLAAAPFFTWTLLGLFRSRLEMGESELRVQNPIGSLAVRADEIVRVAIVERWWSYLAYGPIGRFGLSTPTAKLVLVDGGSVVVSATSPMGEGSAAWSALSPWCIRHAVPIGWE